MTLQALRYSRCGATLKVIAVIEDGEVIYRILAHLNLLAPGTAPGPRLSAAAPPPQSVPVTAS